jgi:hypothetical protein
MGFGLHTQHLRIRVCQSGFFDYGRSARFLTLLSRSSLNLRGTAAYTVLMIHVVFEPLSNRCCFRDRCAGAANLVLSRWARWLVHVKSSRKQQLACNEDNAGV